MPDARKQTQFVEQLWYYRNNPNEYNDAQLISIARINLMHVTSEHYVGIEQFDLVAATADLPDKEQQTVLQTTKSERPVNSVWISYVAKWTECFPNDSTIECAYEWFNKATYGNIIECMPDARKQTQFVEQLWYYRNKPNEYNNAQLISIARINLIHNATVLKVPSKKRKHGH